jgi:hypothetical protein
MKKSKRTSKVTVQFTDAERRRLGDEWKGELTGDMASWIMRSPLTAISDGTDIGSALVRLLDDVGQRTDWHRVIERWIQGGGDPHKEMKALMWENLHEDTIYGNGVPLFNTKEIARWLVAVHLYDVACRFQRKLAMKAKGRKS